MWQNQFGHQPRIREQSSNRANYIRIVSIIVIVISLRTDKEYTHTDYNVFVSVCAITVFDISCEKFRAGKVRIAEQSWQGTHRRTMCIVISTKHLRETLSIYYRIICYSTTFFYRQPLICGPKLSVSQDSPSGI